jgi:predicted nucleic acid-binding protein
MPEIKKRIFWDSCRLLSKTYQPAKLAEHDICQLCFQSAIDGQVEIVTSTITIAEVVKTEELIEPPVPETIREQMRILFNEPYITLISVDLARVQEARELIWKNSWLRPIDAIQISCALYSKVDELFSYDGNGAKKGLLDLDGKLGTPLLKITKPHFQGVQGNLFIPPNDIR